MGTDVTQGADEREGGRAQAQVPGGDAPAASADGARATSTTDARPTDDPVFAQEQRHLTETCGRLRGLADDLERRLRENLAEIEAFKGGMSDELATNLDDSAGSMETYAEYAVMNNVVDSFNLTIDADAESLRRVRLLLGKPYFAKVTLQFPGRPRPRDVYLGAAGVADERHRPIVVDWRSPVAETYYSQQTGPMTYEANGRTVAVDLKVRRQFDITGERLNAYFDTTVAIQDPLLLASLSERRSSRMQAITATIQREQNEVIRHEDAPTLLVRGVAGSGKTSVMLQRIAYLLYRDRASLNADRVCLITPNKVFERYIWDVLPQLGERNPRTVTWPELARRLGAGDRGLGEGVTREALREIDERAAGFVPELSDLTEVHAGERSLISIEQIMKVVERFARVATGPRLMTLVQDELRDRLDRRIEQLAHAESVHDEVDALDADTQDRLFGMVVHAEDEEQATDLARQYLAATCGPAYEQVDDFGWLRVDRIGMRLLGREGLSATEWLCLKMDVTGKVDADARFVMIDEVQDYAAGQLMVLARYFSRAHFLLLGDPNQAIRPGTASFDEIREVFREARGQVDECALMTSYRSSPEITDLFARLLPPAERIQVSSVQRPGEAVEVRCLATGDELVDEVARRLRAVAGEPGLTAVVVGSRKRASWLGRRLVQVMGDDAPVLVEKANGLPDAGGALLDLALAKGLEFDRVIIADAQADEYGADDLSRRRLYTAISRATKRVTILAQGPLTPLLAEAVADGVVTTDGREPQGE